MSEATTPQPQMPMRGQYNPNGVASIDCSDPDPKKWVQLAGADFASEGIDPKKLPFGAQSTTAPVVQTP